MAVSPQLQEFNRKLVEEKGLRLKLVGDPGNGVAREYGLVYKFPEDLRKVYLSFGTDLEKYNGDDSWTLPMPARFVIDLSGTVRSAEINADYTIRPEPEETLKVLECLGGKGGAKDFDSCMKAA